VSTQINVTVDSGGLRARAKQQQNAARQARLDKERTTRIEQQGAEQRTAQKAAAGQNPNGTSRSYPSFRPLAIAEEPSANRRLPTDQLVVYYLDAPPPRTSKQGVIVEDLYPAFSGGGTASYNTVLFQGVRALTAPSASNDLSFPFWLVDSPKEVFDFGPRPFTIELWWRAFDNIVSANNAFSYVALSLGPSITIILEYEGRQGRDPEIFLRDSQSAISSYQKIADVSYPEASSFNHLAIQRHSALAFTAHYKGNVIRSWSRTSDVSFEDQTFFQISASNFFATGAGFSQVRMTKGKAVYGTSSFTPPTTPFFRAPA